VAFTLRTLLATRKAFNVGKRERPWHLGQHAHDLPVVQKRKQRRRMLQRERRKDEARRAKHGRHIRRSFHRQHRHAPKKKGKRRPASPSND
jgi:hypothetical protein